jgi:pimeloyl-ACP methyl ester carboxylesterase
VPNRAEVMTRFVPESGRAIFEIMHWGLDMRRAGEVDVRKLSCPLLVIVGSEDRINPPGTVERVAGLYRELATFEKVPGMSHWLVGEPGWEQVAGRALNWLDEL